MHIMYILHYLPHLSHYLTLFETPKEQQSYLATPLRRSTSLPAAATEPGPPCTGSFKDNGNAVEILWK